MQIGAIAGDEISVDASSGANIKISSGSCTSLDAKATGGAFIDMQEISCVEAYVDARNGSNLSGHAEFLKVDARSGAKIYAYGAPNVDKSNVSSGGEVSLPKEG